MEALVDLSIIVGGMSHNKRAGFDPWIGVYKVELGHLMRAKRTQTVLGRHLANLGDPNYVL